MKRLKKPRNLRRKQLKLPEQGADDMRLVNAINQTCPWSGKPVSEDGLSRYKGHVVGFCNSGCRDKFEKAVLVFEAELSKEH